MTVIMVVGLIRSGKGEAARHIPSKYNYQHLDASDVITDEARKHGIQPTKENLTKIAENLKAQGFQGLIARRLMGKFAEKNVVISGFRAPEQIDYIRNEYDGKAYVIEVWARSDVRLARRKEGEPANEDDFFRRDRTDIQEFGLNLVLEMADRKIMNNDSIEDMRGEIDRFMEEIR